MMKNMEKSPKQNKEKSKGGFEMDAAMIKLAFEMFKNIADLTKRVTEAGDASSYAEALKS